MGLFTERIACLLERTAMGERQIRGLSLRPLDRHFFTYPGQRVPTSESTPAMPVKSFACQMNFNHRPMMRVAGTVALTSLVVLVFTTMPLKAQITTGETPSVKPHTTPAGQRTVGSNLAFESPPSGRTSPMKSRI
jgi:hypothetical protein